jgi:hypothetical protein
VQVPAIFISTENLTIQSLKNKIIMIYSGNIQKMKSIHETPVKYFLQCGDSEIEMNTLIGKKIKIEYQDRINCINCGALTKKSFHQGYCYSCFTSIPQCDIGVLQPEKDMSHLGISRDMEWAKQNSLVDHYVYLALTGNLKVGVTRHTQIPTRWIDQGAIAAIKIAKTPYRNLAGQIEVALKQYISDKTNWAKMLLANHYDIDLKKSKKEIAVFIPDELKKYISLDNSITEIEYPLILSGIAKFKTINLETNPKIESKLLGIKGQYLIFESAEVINIRKHNGYFINIETYD